MRFAAYGCGLILGRRSSVRAERIHARLSVDGSQVELERSARVLFRGIGSVALDVGEAACDGVTRPSPAVPSK